MALLLLAGVVAQGLDALTMVPEHERNPLVRELGSSAYLAKIILLLAVVSLALWLSREPRQSNRLAGFRRAMSHSLATLLLLAGLLGTWSNLPWFGS